MQTEKKVVSNQCKIIFENNSDHNKKDIHLETWQTVMWGGPVNSGGCWRLWANWSSTRPATHRDEVSQYSRTRVEGFLAHRRLNVLLRNHRGYVYWACVEKWLNQWPSHLWTECQDIREGRRGGTQSLRAQDKKLYSSAQSLPPCFPQRMRDVRSCWLAKGLTACLFLKMAYITSTLEGTQTSSRRVLACCLLVSVSMKVTFFLVCWRFVDSRRWRQRGSTSERWWQTWPEPRASEEQHLDTIVLLLVRKSCPPFFFMYVKKLLLLLIFF